MLGGTAKRSRSIRRARQLPSFFHRSTIVRTESGLAREKQPKATGKPAAGTSIGPKAEACVCHWRTIGIEALPSGEGPCT